MLTAFAFRHDRKIKLFSSWKKARPDLGLNVPRSQKLSGGPHKKIAPLERDAIKIILYRLARIAA